MECLLTVKPKDFLYIKEKDVLMVTCGGSVGAGGAAGYGEAWWVRGVCHHAVWMADEWRSLWSLGLCRKQRPCWTSLVMEVACRYCGFSFQPNQESEVACVEFQSVLYYNIKVTTKTGHPAEVCPMTNYTGFYTFFISLIKIIVTGDVLSIMFLDQLQSCASLPGLWYSAPQCLHYYSLSFRVNFIYIL